MSEAYNSALCDNKHTEIERRVSVLEESWDKNLTRIYDELKDVTAAMMRRLPVWVTVVITVLGSLCTGLAVALAAK